MFLHVGGFPDRKMWVYFLTQSWYQAWGQLISRKDGMGRDLLFVSLCSLSPAPVSLTALLGPGQEQGCNTS